MSEDSMTMNCTQFEEIIPDLDRPGTEGIVLRESALVHAESCGHCAALLTESESLDFTLRALAVRDLDRKAPLRVETSLLERFRREKGIVARQRVRLQIAILGTAAVLFLAVGISMSHRPAPVPNVQVSNDPSADN